MNQLKMQFIEFAETESALENETDLDSLENIKISNAVVTATDWTTETILAQIKKGNIHLDPSFQRRDAWDKKRKSRFIESLFLGFPIPQIVLADSQGQRGQFIVIDGKQRLLAIRQFAAGENDNEFERLKLSGLAIRKDLIGKSLEDIQSGGEHQADLSAFENQSIRTVVIRNWPSESFLYHVFLRLNTGSVALSPQELRQALHPGGFIDFVDDYTVTSRVTREILRLERPDFRMRDVELVVRFFAYRNYLSEYRGSLKAFLDAACGKLNDIWKSDESYITAQIEEFEQAHDLVVSVFGENNAYRKWNGNRYENRFNRAIFDIFMYHFSSQAARDSVRGSEAIIEKIFRSLCVENDEFRSSIESTTKSLQANRTRLGAFAEAVNNEIGASLHVVQIVNSRLV